MPADPAIHVVRFRCAQVGLDAALRTELIPALHDREGFLGVVAGRQGPDELGLRLVASIWSSADALAADDAPDGALPGLSNPQAAEDVETENLSIRFLFASERHDPVGIVRALRGRIRPGEMADYVAEARTGTLADVATGGGPLSLYLATRDPTSDEFLTVSTWTDWSAIEKATGGDIHRPLATRHPERIVDFDVEFYEAITL